LSGFVASSIMCDSTKVCSSYGPLAYFCDISISGKNVVISAEKWQLFLPEMKISEKYASGP